MIEGKDVGEIKADFDTFVRLVYPNGMGGDQARQIHRAFYAGALTLFQRIYAIGSESANDAAGAAAIEKLKAELDAEWGLILTAIEGRN